MDIETIEPRGGTRMWIAVGRVGGGIVALAAAALVGLALAGNASAGWGDRGHGFGHGPMGGALEPAEVQERVERMVAHVAIEIDATDEQKEKLTAIFVTAANDLMPMRAEMMASGNAEELVALLTAPTVDRAAIEAFRADKLAIAERASRRIAEALGEAAEVLTPAQRAEIGERIEFLMRLRSGFHRG
jgi:Spy/CpxP family protein refolding chaperone